ncbi:hypothetical protein PALS2_259 [Staphylococcus phage PALS_2]|nr:hypothetical protein PALS2_259 [Staphylococcus phage PALS_2]QQM14706.1 hypothetical protein CPT_MarsHill_172 [Staphylococcus phage MarsHill]QQO92821.1 hypothetical protein CPT_Madawaska_171 [Staphylococcus phage Madawaska]UAJ17006.1 hypothetical protein UFVDC4_00079 [Staphylococcus phage vB_SauM-UFV_DC4]WRM43459.1 hypothetical protein [Staphylococcus phage LY01]BDE75649.1 hypothetical protein [Staphylococcus phage S6]
MGFLDFLLDEYGEVAEGLQGKSEEDIEREYEISKEAGDDYIGGL